MQNNTSETASPIATVLNYIIRAVPYVFVFIASLARPSDLDLGWHLKYGEYFFKTGHILKENIFSTEMPGYHYINHSWATDIFTYTVFNKFGFLGISILSATVLMLAFYFFARASRLTLWEEAFIFPLILYASYDSVGQSFRSQVLSILLLGVVYFVIKIFEERKTPLILLFMVPIFFLWANVHGGFILGLAVLGIWCTLNFIETVFAMYAKKKSFEWSSFAPQAIGVLSFIVTLVNPFGWRLYEEIFRHIGNPLQKLVIEWMPISTNIFLRSAYLVSSAILLVGIFVFYRKKSKTELLYFTIPCIIFWVLTFQQRRYFWPALFVAMPFFGSAISSIKPKSKNITTSVAATVVICSYLFVSAFRLPTEHIFNMDWGYYCRINGCSPGSAEYLASNQLPGKMLTDYNWGGWLIWNYPAIKPTIDGRMPFWKDDTGYSAFKKYIELENNFTDIDRSAFDVVYISPTKKTIFNRLQQLVGANKWHVAYHDLFSYVFVRNK